MVGPGPRPMQADGTFPHALCQPRNPRGALCNAYRCTPCSLCNAYRCTPCSLCALRARHKLMHPLRPSRPHEAFLFVHGLGVDMHRALRHYAQMMALVAFPPYISPVLFSWPSSNPLGYFQVRLDTLDTLEASTNVQASLPHGAAGHPDTRHQHTRHSAPFRIAPLRHHQHEHERAKLCTRFPSNKASRVMKPNLALRTDPPPYLWRHFRPFAAPRLPLCSSLTPQPAPHQARYLAAFWKPTLTRPHAPSSAFRPPPPL